MLLHCKNGRNRNKKKHFRASIIVQAQGDDEMSWAMTMERKIVR
jgi:hypothetical protein